MRSTSATEPLTLAWHPRLAVLFALLFCITYFEPITVAGVRFAVLWRALFVLPAALYIALNPWRQTALTEAMAPLFWAWLVHAMAPIVSALFGGSPPGDAVALTAQRMLPPVVAMLTISGAMYAQADAVLRALPFFLCGVSVFLLTGVIQPTGYQFSLDHLAGVSASAYTGTFQNQHSAALTHSIAAVLAFALAASRPTRLVLPQLLAGIGCALLTLATTARTGLIGLLLGLLCLVLVRGDWRLLGWPLAAIAVATVGAAVLEPELFDLAQNRLLGRTIYQEVYVLDSFTSGRLGLQEAALDAYLGFDTMGRLFGVGQLEGMNSIDRLFGSQLLAHNAFIDELLMHGVPGLIGLIAAFAMALRLAWTNFRYGYPLSLGLVLLCGSFALLQGADYSLQTSLVALAILIETAVRLERVSGSSRPVW